MNVCVRSVGQKRVDHEDEVLPESSPRALVPLNVDEDETGRHPASLVLQGLGGGPGDLIIIDNALTCQGENC